MIKSVPTARWGKLKQPTMNSELLSIEPLRRAEVDRFFQWRKGDGSLEMLCDVKDTIGGFQAGTVWIWIAKVGETWAGSVKLQRFHHDTAMADGQKRGYLGALDVEVEFRRQGIGRALTERSLEFARERGVSEVTLNLDPTNQAASALYRSLGFEKFKTAVLLWQGEDVNADCLMVSLFPPTP